MSNLIANINLGLNNNENIKSNDYINLNARTITNNSGVILSNGKASLISTDDFVNKNGGIIKGSDVQIASINGNIINETFSKQNTINNGANNFTYTQIGNQSQIEATNGQSFTYWNILNNTYIIPNKYYGIFPPICSDYIKDSIFAFYIFANSSK